MQAHTVVGGGGVRLHVREWGAPKGPPILFIHGWSQNHLCWSRQLASPLAEEYRLVAMDIRGHGQSEAPPDAASYTDGALWADDVAGVIAALDLERPVLVGWSYAGLIVSDYIRKYGDNAIAGVDFVGAAIGIGKRWFGSRIGPGFMDNLPPACSEDQTIALQGIHGLLQASFVKPVAFADRELAMGCAMLVSPAVRAYLVAREEDFTPDLARMTRPALVTYGDADTVILPSMARAILGSVPDSEASLYPGVGHVPFIEEPERFNAELGAFARRTRGGA